MKTIHIAYCDRYELARGNQPTLFNRKFWHGDGTPAIRVKVMCSDEDFDKVMNLRRAAEAVRGGGHCPNDTDGYGNCHKCVRLPGGCPKQPTAGTVAEKGGAE